MKGRSIRIRGELYLTLETVAECYRLELSWLREVYELDLLGAGERIDDQVAIASRMLDRVAELRRLSLISGAEPGVVAWMIRGR